MTYFDYHMRKAELLSTVLSTLNLHSNLRDWFVKFLVFHEMTNKELKIYNSLRLPSAKLGYLSRKLIKTANKVKVPQTIVKEYIAVKNEYAYLKSIPAVDVESAVIGDRIIAHNIYYAGVRAQHANARIQNVYITTIKLIRCILENTQLEEITND